MTRLESKLAQAVRDSLNLPELRVSVRYNRSHRNWRFRLHQNRRASEGIVLDAESVKVIKKIGLLPALHLGTFRLAYAALHGATEQANSFLRKPSAQTKGSRKQAVRFGSLTTRVRER